MKERRVHWNTEDKEIYPYSFSFTYWINTTYQVCAFINYSITARILFLLKDQTALPTTQKVPPPNLCQYVLHSCPSLLLHALQRLNKDPWIYKRRKSWSADTQKAAETQHTHPSTLNNNSYKLQIQTVTFTFIYSLFMVKITSSLSFPVQMQPKGLQQYKSEHPTTHPTHPQYWQVKSNCRNTGCWRNRLSIQLLQNPQFEANYFSFSDALHHNEGSNFSNSYWFILNC